MAATQFNDPTPVLKMLAASLGGGQTGLTYSPFGPAGNSGQSLSELVSSEGGGTWTPPPPPPMPAMTPPPPPAPAGSNSPILDAMGLKWNTGGLKGMVGGGAGLVRR